MRSFMTVDRIERNYAVCELELIDTETSKQTAYWDRETQMVDIPILFLHGIVEGDVVIVEHQGEAIERVLGKDEAERQKRVDALKGLGF